MNSRIALRLIVKLSDENAALQFAGEVLAKIGAFGKIKNTETLRYWKVPECFEINISLETNGNAAFAYDGILSTLGQGWVLHGFPGEYQWAVWNPKQDSSFFSSDVCWANVERFPESWIIAP
jgi:hypothetical protein